MKSLLVLSISILALFIFPKNTSAISNPLDFPNNKYGIHIMNESDLEEANALVNSSGGEWGYVTVVIRKDERNIDRWQRAFDEMRRKKLIPIVRLATRQTPEGWDKFTYDDIHNWVYFLNSLNWVIENRYIIVGNEPNHATEWGGEINPEEYSDYLLQLSKDLKTSSDDFFIIPAGFDASAPNGNNHMSEDVYLDRMVDKNPDLFEYVDGWASHSYPNPGFSGSTSDSGRGSIKTYEWELRYLESLGVQKELPVFITETGWVHNMESNLRGLLHPQFVGENYRQAFEQVWHDDRIVAITPFILSYQDPPFDIFSWKNKDGLFYDFYYDIQKIEKHRGSPSQISSASINTVMLPDKLHRRNGVTGFAVVENLGQDIWDKNQIKLVFEDADTIIFNSFSNSEIVEPEEKTIIFFDIKKDINENEGIQLSIRIRKNEDIISSEYKLSHLFESQSVRLPNNIQENKPSFGEVKTILPVVMFNKKNNDILASI